MPSYSGGKSIYNQGDALIVGDIRVETALGNVRNYAISTKFGSAALLDVSSVCTIWSFADDDLSTRRDRKVFSFSSTAVYAVSDSLADVGKTITVKYHNALNARLSVDLVLNGTTPVLVSADALDADTAYISGPLEVLDGNVYIMRGNAVTAGIPDDTADVLAFIRQGSGRTQLGAIRVPSGVDMVITQIHASATRSSGAAGSARVNLHVLPLGKSWYVLRPFLVTNSRGVDYNTSLPFGPGDIVEFFIDNISDNNTSINVFFTYQFITRGA